MVKQPGHLTSMKKERGWGTRVCRDNKSVKTCSHMRFSYHHLKTAYSISFQQMRGVAGCAQRTLMVDSVEGWVVIIPSPIGAVPISHPHPHPPSFANFISNLHFYQNPDSSYLQLVLASLSLRRGVEEVDRENLSNRCHVSRMKSLTVGGKFSIAVAQSVPLGRDRKKSRSSRNEQISRIERDGRTHHLDGY
jgi:hypothetical protein